MLRIYATIRVFRSVIPSGINSSHKIKTTRIFLVASVENDVPSFDQTTFAFSRVCINPVMRAWVSLGIVESNVYKILFAQFLCSGSTIFRFRETDGASLCRFGMVFGYKAVRGDWVSDSCLSKKIFGRYYQLIRWVRAWIDWRAAWCTLAHRDTPAAKCWSSASNGPPSRGR